MKSEADTDDTRDGATGFEEVTAEEVGAEDVAEVGVDTRESMEEGAGADDGVGADEYDVEWTPSPKVFVLETVELLGAAAEVG